jgi:hypothetical protein
VDTKRERRRREMSKLLKALLTGDDDEKEDWSWGGKGAGKGSWGEKGKGKGKGKGPGGANKFENTDGTLQSRCWEFDEHGTCEKLQNTGWCAFAHPNPRNGKNENYVKPREGGGKGEWKGGGAGAGAGKGTTTGTGGGSQKPGTKKVIGRSSVEAEGDEKSEAKKLREQADEAIIDPRGLADRGKGVEVLMMMTLTEAAEAMEVDSNGDSTKIMVMVDRGAKEAIEELKGFVSTKAKRNGKSLGEEGLEKIREHRSCGRSRSRIPAAEEAIRAGVPEETGSEGRREEEAAGGAQEEVGERHEHGLGRGGTGA